MKTDEKKDGSIGFFRKMGDVFGMKANKKTEESATDVFFRTKYGGIMSPEAYVKAAQSHIRKMVNARSDMFRRSPEDSLFRSYYCMVDFDSEMSDYMDEIFNPFIEAGYVVTKLSGKIEEIKDEQVYLISWDKRGGLSKSTPNG